MTKIFNFIQGGGSYPKNTPRSNVGTFLATDEVNEVRLFETALRKMHGPPAGAGPRRRTALGRPRLHRRTPG